MLNPLQALKNAVNKQNEAKKTAETAAANQLKVIEAAKKASKEVKNGGV